MIPFNKGLSNQHSKIVLHHLSIWMVGIDNFPDIHGNLLPNDVPTNTLLFYLELFTQLLSKFALVLAMSFD
jgi:hypothetical protein